MFPILLEINGIPIYAHGFFLNLALLVCLLVIIGESRRRRWPKEEIIPITLAAFVGGMIGARVSIVFFNGWETAPIVLNFYRLFDPRIRPGSILGGVAGAYVAGFIVSRVIGKAGCAIRGGKWLPEAMQFMQTHQAALAQKPFAAFLVCIMEKTCCKRSIPFVYRSLII